MNFTEPNCQHFKAMTAIEQFLEKWWDQDSSAHHMEFESDLTALMQLPSREQAFTWLLKEAFNYKAGDSDLWRTGAIDLLNFLTQYREQTEAMYYCTICGGHGKETCPNPDHGFISALSFHDIGRIGCPGCGHDEHHRMSTNCEKCNGTGWVIEPKPDTSQVLKKLQDMINEPLTDDERISIQNHIREQSKASQVGMTAEAFRKVWLKQNPNIIHIPSEHEIGLMEAFAAYYYASQQRVVTDEEIEKWAEKSVSNPFFNDADVKTAFNAEFLVKMIKASKITGAKAMRDNKIK